MFTGQFDDNEIAYAFKQLDKDKNGFISLRELKQIFSKLGQHFTEVHIAGLISMVDVNKDGKLDFNGYFYNTQNLPNFIFDNNQLL